MGEIGAHDNERLLVAPDALQRRGNFLRRRIAGGDRQYPKVAEQHLQKRQLHLQAVLVRVRRVRGLDVRDAHDLAACGVVHSNGAQRRFEGIGSGYRQAGEGHVVARADQDDALDCMRGIAERAVGRSGYGPGVDIAGVWRNQGFRHRCPPRTRGVCNGRGRSPPDSLS